MAIRKMPATAKQCVAEPLVLLHGWGCDSHSWQPIIIELNRFACLWLVDLPGFGRSCCPGSDVVQGDDLSSMIDQLTRVLPPRAIYLGWSLGGMLATLIAARQPSRVSKLITLAANLSFVQRENWPCAMPEQTFLDFYQSFVDAPEATLKRFYALQARGDARERGIHKVLRQQLWPRRLHGAWSAALKLFADIDNREAFARLTQPGLHLFGAEDGLVPCAVAKQLRCLNTLQKTQVLSSVGHVVHASEPGQVVKLIRAFVQGDNYKIDKCKVAESFSRAAPTYDSVAQLQRRIGCRLLNYAPPQEVMRLSHREMTILDLGCGTGHFCTVLKQCFPRARIVGLDIAAGMLTFARQAGRTSDEWVCGDAELLPLADSSVDMIFSSLAIQWCGDLTAVFSEVKRVLKPQGRAMLSTLGPATLHELKAAWQRVDNFVHVNEFTPQPTLKAYAQQVGFGEIASYAEKQVLHYDQLRGLTYALKALGAHNMNAGQGSGLGGRRRMHALRDAYEVLRVDKGLPATYEVFYLLLHGAKVV